MLLQKCKNEYILSKHFGWFLRKKPLNYTKSWWWGWTCYLKYGVIENQCGAGESLKTKREYHSNCTNNDYDSERFI